VHLAPCSGSVALAVIIF